MCTFDLFDEGLSILSLRLCPAEKEYSSFRNVVVCDTCCNMMDQVLLIASNVLPINSFIRDNYMEDIQY